MESAVLNKYFYRARYPGSVSAGTTETGKDTYQVLLDTQKAVLGCWRRRYPVR